MTLNELEKVLNVEFPKKWHEISNSGAMDWLELDSDFEDFSERLHTYINDPHAFLMLACDCEPLMYADIPERFAELNEWISYKTKDTGEKLKDGVRLIPFAQTAGGDLYCFVYGEDNSEPQIVLYHHDDYDAPDIYAKDFEEFLYVAMLDSASWEEDIESENWENHLEFLTDEYKVLIQGKTEEELIDTFENMPFAQADIFV